MKKYGLLDPMPLGEKEKHPLKCELCGLNFDDKKEKDHIDKTGFCTMCFIHYS